MKNEEKGEGAGRFSSFRKGVSGEGRMFYSVLTARVIFMAKISLDVFSLSPEQVWTFSVLGDRIYKMRCLFVPVGLMQCPLYSAASLG